MNIALIFNIFLIAFISWRLFHLYTIVKGLTSITLIDKYLRKVIIFILLIIPLTVLLGFIQRKYGVEVDPFYFAQKLFKHSEFIIMIALPLITILLAILSFLNIQKKIIFPIIMIGGFFIILILDAFLFSLEYAIITDMLIDDTAIRTYKILTFELFIYSAMMAITSIAVIYPDFENFVSESKSKYLKLIAISIFIILGSFIPGSLVMNKILDRYEINPIVDTTSDLDAIEILDYFAEVGKEMSITEEDALSYLDLIVSDKEIGLLGMVESITDKSDEIDLEIVECILYNEKKCLEDLLEQYLAPKESLSEDILFNFHVFDMYLFRYDYIINNPEFIRIFINRFSENLIKLKINKTEDLYNAIALLHNQIGYSMKANLPNLTYTLLSQFNQYILSTTSKNPYQRIFGLTELANLYAIQGKFHKSEKILLSLRNEFEKAKHLGEKSAVNKRYFLEFSDKMSMVLAQIILRQRPSSELSLKLFRDFMSKDVIDPNNPFNTFSYLIRRNYYELTMQSLGYLLFSYPEKEPTIRNEIITLIEKNKSRSFVRNNQFEWITDTPTINKNQAGLNYITSKFITLGQYYDVDTTISFVVEKPADHENDDFSLSQLWNINYMALLSDTSLNELKIDIKNKLVDKLFPSDIQNRIKDKDLIISPDGVLNQIPFQWLLSEKNIKSIKYIPGFTYFNKNSMKSSASLLAVAVPSPDYIVDHIQQESITEIYRGQSPTDSLVFAIKEAKELVVKGKKNGIKTNLSINPTETWIKRNLNKYDMIHFATHSISSNAYGQGNTGVLLIKDGENDGFLSEEEISKLKLNGQIIFLSSCESGIGEFSQGEGLLSISRAFLSAGANGVISSLWKVNDKSAKDISLSYYENYFNLNSPEDALYNAQKNYNSNDLWQKYSFIYTSF